MWALVANAFILCHLRIVWVHACVYYQAIKVNYEIDLLRFVLFDL